MQILDINRAPFEELKLLPGVGAITARRIIANRPYDEPYDLVMRCVLGVSLYEKNEQRLMVGCRRIGNRRSPQYDKLLERQASVPSNTR